MHHTHLATETEQKRHMNKWLRILGYSPQLNNKNAVEGHDFIQTINGPVFFTGRQLGLDLHQQHLAAILNGQGS